jgi:hypothetical protein
MGSYIYMGNGDEADTRKAGIMRKRVQRLANLRMVASDGLMKPEIMRDFFDQMTAKNILKSHAASVAAKGPAPEPSWKGALPDAGAGEGVVETNGDGLPFSAGFDSRAVKYAPWEDGIGLVNPKMGYGNSGEKDY